MERSPYDSREAFKMARDLGIVAKEHQAEIDSLSTKFFQVFTEMVLLTLSMHRRASKQEKCTIAEIVANVVMGCDYFRSVLDDPSFLARQVQEAVRELKKGGKLDE